MARSFEERTRSSIFSTRVLARAQLKEEELADVLWLFQHAGADSEFAADEALRASEDKRRCGGLEGLAVSDVERGHTESFQGDAGKFGPACPLAKPLRRIRS